MPPLAVGVVAFGAAWLLLLGGTGRISLVPALTLAGVLSIAGPERLLRLAAAIIALTGGLGLVQAVPGIDGASIPVPLTGVQLGIEWLLVPSAVGTVYFVFFVGRRHTSRLSAGAAAILAASLFCFALGAERLHLSEANVLLGLNLLLFVWATAAAVIAASGSGGRPGQLSATVTTVLALTAGLVALPQTRDVVYQPGHTGVLWPDREEGDYLPGGGLFGSVPPFLANAGEMVVRVVSLDGSTDGLDRLVVLSGFRAFSATEIDKVGEWVANGGRLLVVGEHTNLGATAENLDPLLEPFGLRLGFDTTNGLLGDRLAGSAWSEDVLTLSPTLQVGRGASLRLSGGSRALAVGTWWHGDAGETEAPERAFLSDYRLSRGDQLGGVVLVAENRTGEGRVVAFGDSEPFLEGHLATSSLALLGLLGGEARWSARGLALVAMVLLTLGLGVASWRRSSEVLDRLLLCAAALVLVASTAAAPSVPVFAERIGSLAVVSEDENNLFDRDPFEAAGVGALTIALVETGYVPHVGSWRSLEARPRAVLILNPTTVPERGAWTRLMRWVEQGTLLVVMGGGEERAFRRIASRLGIEVGKVPLGNLRGRRFRTYEAWSIEGAPQGTGLLRAETVPVLATMTVGEGQVWVIADRGFLLSKNLRHEGFVDRLNLELVAEVLGRAD